MRGGRQSQIMSNTGTFKPLCIRGHIRQGNVDKDGGCLICQDLLRKGVVQPIGPKGMRKEFCRNGHSKIDNTDKGGGCLSCQPMHRENEIRAWKNNPERQEYWKNQSWVGYGIKNSDGSNFEVKDYNRIFQIQGGRCKGCNRHQSEFKKSLIADHDHKTGRFRGLLCFQCNFILGNAKDNTEILIALTDYLRSSS